MASGRVIVGVETPPHDLARHDRVGRAALDLGYMLDTRLGHRAMRVKRRITWHNDRPFRIGAGRASSPTQWFYLDVGWRRVWVYKRGHGYWR